MNTSYKYYAGNMVYNNDKSLNYLLFDEGLVNKVSGGYAYEYQLKDHLGNTRVTFQPNGSATTTTQVAEYYPFGSSYLPVSPAGSNKYLYNGKEKQDDVLSGTVLDWYDYGARFYDPAIGRWNTPDPLALKKIWQSPYVYCSNNSINRIDPDGKDDFFKRNGTFAYHTVTKVNHIMIIDGKGEKSLTSYNYSSKNSANRNMLSNVGTYYANKAGINQQVGVKDVDFLKVGDAFASTGQSTLNVSINTDQKTGMINSNADIADNMVNSFVHEKNHIDNPKLMNTPEGEINAIKTQVLDPTFSNTSSNFKIGIMKYAAQQLNLETVKNNYGTVFGDILNLNILFSGFGNRNLNFNGASGSVVVYPDPNILDEVIVTAPKIK